MSTIDMPVRAGSARRLRWVSDGAGNALRGLLRTVQGRIGLALGILMLVVILIGPSIAPFSPTAIGLGVPNSGPSASHLFGTDSLGRDVLSRVLSGGRSVLVVPLLAVILSSVVGGALGMLAGYAGGLWDKIIARLFDVVLALPPLLLALVLIAGLGTSNSVLILAVALIFFPRTGRVMRGATQAVVTSDYIAAAQARGESLSFILGRELLPNVAVTAIAEFVLRLTWAIIFVATLNFLGLGAQPPSSNWGLMVAQGWASIGVNPTACLAPAAGIALIAIASNLVADALSHSIETGRRRAKAST